ncbi:hypothetical protein Tco_0452430 [Tanacetum coccineum]
MSSVGKFVHDSNKAPDSPPHPHTFSSNQRHCFHCKDVLGDGEFCQRCTCMRCGSGLSKGLCLICASRYGNNPNPNSLNDSPNISENVSQSPPLIDHHCCYECEEPLDGFFCQQCTCKSCGNGAYYGYNCPWQVPIISNPEPCNNQTVDEFPQTLPSFYLTCYSGDGSSFTYDSTPNFVDDSPNAFNLPSPSQPQRYSIYENIHEELSEYINSPSWNRPTIYFDDDDDEESSIPLGDIISELPPCIAIIPVLSTKEPYSVEDLVPIPSESEGIPDDMCDVPFRDNSPPLDISKDQFEDFSNSNDDCTSSDEDYSEDIDYVEASSLDSELVSFEEVKDFDT